MNFLYKIFIKNIFSNKAFTVVELTIIITILAILGTLAFLGFKQYTGNTRDSNRLQTIQNIESGLQLAYAKTKKYSQGENNITILSGGTIIGYQGDFGDNNAKIINMNTVPLDPLDNQKYTYYVDSKNRKYQILAFMEEYIGYNSIIQETYAIDYSIRKPRVFGKNLGVLLSINNTPVQNLSLTGIDIATTTTQYKAIIDNTASGTIIGTGGILVNFIKR
ncbi:MAG: hypothetical protein PHE25_00860 [Candidatus Gracilibacteria bacterium]|nr:hypothetical protein [Candidatus Gracilibacteria bacterium]